MKYTYLLLHPSSNIFVDRIFKTLIKKGFIITAVYKVSAWDTILWDLYRSSFRNSETVEEHVMAHAYINKYLFGNRGVLLLLSKNISYDNLIKETLEVKNELRNTMDKTKDGTISIFLNMKQEVYNLKTAQDKKKVDVFFSYIHCPDTKIQYDEDFRRLREVMVEKNRLGYQEIEDMIKYHSYFGS